MNTQGHIKTEMGSERSFSIVFAAAFSVIGLWPMWAGQPARLWAFAVGATILGVGLLWPIALRPLNIAWFRFGLLLGRLTTPIFMAVLYFGVFTPFSLAMRLLGVPILGGKCRADRETYWIERAQRGPLPESMRNQF